MVNTTFITFFFLLLLSACQVKESVSNGGLISGHTPTTNKFTVTPPANKTYIEGEILRFKLSFPFEIHGDFSGGDPILNIKIGGVVRSAILKELPTTQELVFEYEITNTDNAPIGVEVQSLSLNGSILQFLKEEVLVNCDVASVKPILHSNVKIDTEKPRATQIKITSLPGLYHAGNEILFSVTFSEKVFITGTPEFGFKFNTKDVSAKYLSGTGSGLLVFSYIVQDSDFDTNGFNSPATDLNLASATIKDAVGNNAQTSISTLTGAMITQSALYKVVGTLPSVVAIKLPANGIYEVAKTLEFEFEFDRPVNVTGTPKYVITVGQGASKTTRDANYISGAGTNKLIFSYVTVPGDVDPDGIEVDKKIIQEPGSNITAVLGGTSFFSVLENNILTPPSSVGIILKSLLPQAISVARNDDTTKELKNNTLDNVWIIGQKLLVTVNFNTGIVVNTSTGIPTIELFVGGAKKEATYLSGGDGQTSLIFTYTILEGDSDNTGNILLGNIVPHGATITDSLNTIANLTLPAGSRLNTIRIDGIRPTITSVTPPADKTYSNVVTGMTYLVKWSEEVHLGSATGLGLTIDIGGSNTNFPTLITPPSVLNSNFTQPTLTGKNDDDGVTLVSPLVTTGKVFDTPGNEAVDLSFTPPVTPSIKVDTQKPKILSITPQVADGIYKAGQEIIVTVIFDELVEAIVSGTTNHLKLKVGATNKFLVPTANKTSTIHDFKYTVQPNDDGVFSIQNIFAGKIYDLGQNTPDVFVAPTTPGIIIDAKTPTISSTSSTLAAKTLVEGDELEVSIVFSEIVNVDTSSGTPSVPVNFGKGENDLIYKSGSGTTTLVFSRIITENHFNMKGLPATVNTLSLNSGSILDKADHPVPLTYAGKDINLSAIKITYPEVKVWSSTDFKNIAPSPVSLSNFGSVSTVNCGKGKCRTFNDGDNLRYSGNYSSDSHVLMVVKAPAIATGTLDIVSTNLQLVESTPTQYDVTIVNGTIQGGPATLNSNSLYLIHTHNQPLTLDNTMDFFSPDFDGAVGEIIIIDDAINPAKLNEIKTYLNGQFF